MVSSLNGQSPLYSSVLVSDGGINNNIGNANSSRNIVVANNGDIYVVFSGDAGIRVAKSVNRGQSFSPSILITAVDAEPEIIVNNQNIVFVSWTEAGNIMLSISNDLGQSFSVPRVIGSGSFSVHMAVVGSNLYITDKTGGFVYTNFNNGIGTFTSVNTINRVFTDIWVDQNGNIYLPQDDPNLFLSRSTDSGFSFNSLPIFPSGRILFSSYALSDGPCGTYIFVGGGGASTTLGYKIDVTTGLNTIISLGDNFSFQGRTLFADHRGTLIDGYQNGLGELVMNVSTDQGQTFGSPIVIAQGGSHNIARNPVTEDIVVVYEQLGQIYVSVYDNLLKSIKIEDAPPIAVCSYETLNVPFTLSNGFGAGTTLELYISDASGSFENKTLLGTLMTNTSGNFNVPLPNALLPGNNYRLLIEAPADCTQSNDATLTINDVPTATVATISPICENDDAVFNFTGTPNAEVFYSLDNGVTTSSIVLDSSGVAVLTLTEAKTDVSLTLQSVINNTTSCESLLTQTETVVVNPLPIINTDLEYLLCVDLNGTEVSYTSPIIDTFLSATDYFFTWYRNGVALSQFTNQSLIMPTQGGDYLVEVEHQSTGCTALSDLMFVYESSPPNLSASVSTEAFSDNHVINVQAINTATSNPVGIYEFSLNNGDFILGEGTIGGAFSITFDENVRLGGNSIIVRDANGCGETEIIVVVMDYPLYFTPNGDGFHDTWQIAAPQIPRDYLALANIKIFDRYGKLLKQLNPLGLGWDGTYNGDIMPTDDYWFTVNFVDPLDDQAREFRAHFTLKR